MSLSKKKIFTWLPIAIGIGLIALTPVFGVVAGSCMGYHEFVMQTLRDCPQAEVVLGDDIGLGWVGMSCGSAETDGGHGQASWTLPVQGSKGSGSYSFYLEKHGGDWEMKQASLEVGDRKVDVVACAPASSSSGGKAPSGPCSSADQCATYSVKCFQAKDMLCAEKYAKLACDKGNIPSCGNLAHVLIFEKDEPELALEYASKSCQADGSSGCNNLAYALRKLGRSDEAYEAIKKACSLGLDVACSWRSLYELERKDLDLAKRHAHKAMKMNPNRSSAHRRLGHVYLFEGELDLAMASYAKALSKARASDAGQSVKEDLGKPELDLIRDEIKGLVEHHPEREAVAEVALQRVRSMAAAVESPTP